MQNLKCFNFTVYGRVQGVGFRYFTLQIAQSMQLLGYVRNTENGTVIGTVAGKDSNLQLFFEAINKGPKLSRVDRVLTEPGTIEGLQPFNIRQNF